MVYCLYQRRRLRPNGIAELALDRVLNNLTHQSWFEDPKGNIIAQITCLRKVESKELFRYVPRVTKDLYGDCTPY